jgi:hypothetical protein
MANSLSGDSADPAVPGVQGKNTSSTGVGVEGDSPSGWAVYGHSVSGRGVVAQSDTNYGVRASSRTLAGIRASSVESRGVEGWSTKSEGVVGISTNGTGVWGQNETTGIGTLGSSNSGPGVRGTSVDGPGVEGFSTSRYGVAGESQKSAGVRGTSRDSRGVEGWSTNSEGVMGLSANGTGVWGQNETIGIGTLGSSKSGSGVQGTSVDGRGVVGHSNNGAGVWGTSINFEAIHAETTSPMTAAIAAYNNNEAGTGAAIFAKKRGNLGHAGFFDGNVHVTGDISLSNSDCAEDFDIAHEALGEPGTVMVVGDDGLLHESCQGYDKRVAGVVSGAANYKPGIVLGKQQSQINRKPIALLGKVFCKVDARYGPIDVGDLLTTSPTPGHAMRTDDPLKAFGAVIGKALRPLTEGQGLIPILIALQ